MKEKNILCLKITSVLPTKKVFVPTYYDFDLVFKVLILLKTSFLTGNNDFAQGLRKQNGQYGKVTL